MNIKHITLAALLLASAHGFSQKDELKSLKKIYDKGASSPKDVTEYRAALDKAAAVIGSASAADQAYFNYYKASAPFLEVSTPANKLNPQNAMRNVTVGQIKEYAAAASAVIALEKSQDKKQMTAAIDANIKTLRPLILNYAVKLGENKKLAEASDVLYATYQMDPSDPDTLYYAALYAVDAKDIESALRYFNELRDINFSGEGTRYFATNLANDTETEFATEAEMNRYVGLKTHAKPRSEKVPSKRGEIYKSIALILVAQGKTDEAKSAIAKARSENPDDLNLLMTEADLYLTLKDMDGYKRVISQVLEKRPNDPDLNYNLGVVTLNGGQPAEAEKYFLRAIELKPTYANAYVNLAAIKLKADEKLVEEMNKLGTSTADNKRYETLKAERNKLFRSTLPLLEKAYELEPANGAVIDNLMSVYNYLEMTDKYKALKAQQQ